MQEDNISELNTWMNQTDHLRLPQSEVKDLFSELGSWMEESRRKFSNIIFLHNSNIIKGVNDLVEANVKLQAELSAVKKEKNVLIETVNSLNGEIKRHNDNAAREDMAKNVKGRQEVDNGQEEVNHINDIETGSSKDAQEMRFKCIL